MSGLEGSLVFKIPLGILVLGSVVYCALSLLGAVLYLLAPPRLVREFPGISILKPLAGWDEGLEENLRSFFELDYPDCELLFGVAPESGRAANLIRKLRLEYPGVPARVLTVEAAAGFNPKVETLCELFRAARYDVIVVSDSDVRVDPLTLAGIASDFADDRVGLVACPYRAIAGKGCWSQLEAAGMNTEFLGGVLTARILEGMKFAIGAFIAVRRSALEEIGGFERLLPYLADDFVLGQLVAASGRRVVLSGTIVEHRIGSQSFASSFEHRLRWSRSTRRSRPRGYWGQAFTYPIPLAALLWIAVPKLWPLAAVAMLVRMITAACVNRWVFQQPYLTRLLWLVPLQDAISFAAWVGGFFGDTIVWRGRKYIVLEGGYVQELGAPVSAARKGMRVSEQCSEAGRFSERSGA